MIALLSLLSVAVFPAQGCSDVFFLEKNQISNFVRYSRSRGATHVSTPALNFVLDLEKNGFGKTIYSDDLEASKVFMLYAYKSSQNLHIYRICEKDMDVSLIIGPIVKDTTKFVGYKIDINDIHRFDKHLADTNFNMFGNDVDALKAEISKERENQILEQRQKHVEDWEKKPFLSKCSYYLTFMFYVLIVLALFSR